MNRIFNILFLGTVVFAVYIYQDTLRNIWLQSYHTYFPCRSPIAYSLGQFDTDFGLTKEEFLTILQDAESLWETTVGKDLFKYKTGGDLKINLIFDERQESTLQLKEIGAEVENSRASYDNLKIKYDSMLSLYNQTKTTFENKVSKFEARKKAYELEVSQINSRGGANKQTVERLNTEKSYLNQEIASINQMQANLSSQVSAINQMTKTLNSMAGTLNLNVKEFNTIGRSLGEEFEEGSFTSDSSGRRIDIYQFENRTKLVRLLAHELGHALGIDHIEDPKAIMYRLNNGVNEKATASDIVELKKLCGIN